jgi:protein-tyrosine phosphatase
MRRRDLLELALPSSVMDFFSAVADPSQPIIHNDRPLDSANDSFAEAIASRFGSSALLTTRLTPVTLAPPFCLQSSPMPNMPVAPHLLPRTTSSMSPNSSQLAIHFTTITVNALGPWTGDPTALILDIRPHAAYSTARIPRAVSLSVPSTLLKRPLFSLSRLADMLPSANARARFSSWRSASRILVYDADSSVILESSNIYGLLRKLKNDGFQGDLAWLKGGFQAVWRESRDTIDAYPPTPDVENDDDDDEDRKSFPSQTPNVLRTRQLPMSAFSFSSTTVSSSPSLNLTNSKRGPSFRGSTFPKLPTPSQNQTQPAYNPFFDAVRQNRELSQGITERIPLRLPRRVRRRIHELPFHWLREIARRAGKLGPRPRSAIDSSSSASEESEDDENITSADVEEGKDALATQFYKVEVAEQRRLMGIMEYHTKETAIVTTDTDSAPTSSGFPYSITAGVEKGAKNRLVSYSSSSK